MDIKIKLYNLIYKESAPNTQREIRQSNLINYRIAFLKLYLQKVDGGLRWRFRVFGSLTHEQQGSCKNNQISRENSGNNIKKSMWIGDTFTAIFFHSCTFLQIETLMKGIIPACLSYELHKIYMSNTKN